MPTCECGTWVSSEYHRVFSDNEGELRACLSCDSHGGGYTL